MSSPQSRAGSPQLTERDRAVLQYLPTLYTASEIAADLFVSVNTVKTHQRSIYRKLGVSGRRDAVDGRARSACSEPAIGAGRWVRGYP